MSKKSAKQNIEQYMSWLEWFNKSRGKTQNKRKFSKAKAYNRSK